ncbi:hypothetical protein GCM10010425_81090 [Streptomyces spororaveus]|uniref:Uncharacterized protein n=1 Tax=Streptomyces spororaveus TaxID=284039 RepID=A0ABQ3T3C8_9ACTN|nr:hypothetical protein Sspor_04490 [Streptomyces spororaveus]
MRLGTVRPFSVTGRDRISAAREAVDVVALMRVLRVEAVARLGDNEKCIVHTLCIMHIAAGSRADLLRRPCQALLSLVRVCRPTSPR